ncbi:MAG: EthD domain-containing protein [Deltaproteobacteria bacterium]|nr:EthD domain-containing protein [Deltaproteobacteria bacterium]
MKKLQYLVRGPERRPLDAFGADVLIQLAPRLLALSPARLKLTFTADTPPRLSVIPFRRTPLALISVWTDDDGDGAAAAWADAARAAGLGAVTGYRVDESYPRAYARDWPDQARTPGAGLLTLLSRKKGLGDAEFFRRWFDGHSPLSLRIHPLWCYVRNVVHSPVVPGSPALDGIVEEHFRPAQDLTNPFRFFGGLPWMPLNMLRVALDIQGFLDLRTLASWYVAEYWLKS